ncbi:sodium:calcium antiporter [Candidatus Woesearchaeota archaeon]|nr:sodium:calcium antiporter [Candidatus Woesearchaeota archaeon]
MFMLNLGIFVVACIVLVKSSGSLVRSLIKISSFLRLNEFTIGFIIMAISTSLPEMFVGIMSAINNVSSFSLGNVIGSNILDLTIVVGIVAVLAKGIRIKSKIIKKDLAYMMFFIFLPILLMVDAKLWRLFGFTNATIGLTRPDGVILLLAFIIYLWSLVKQEKLFRKSIDHTPKREIFKYIFFFILSISLLFVSSDYVVKYAELLSLDLNVPPILIGLFLISFGTSLPELMFETKAVLSRHEEMAVGDLIGSVITNSTLVLGVTAIITPITGNLLVFFSSTIFLVLIAFIFITFAESDHGLSWKEGMSLILLYIFFIVIETYIKATV